MDLHHCMLLPAIVIWRLYASCWWYGCLEIVRVMLLDQGGDTFLEDKDWLSVPTSGDAPTRASITCSHFEIAQLCRFSLNGPTPPSRTKKPMSICCTTIQNSTFDTSTGQHQCPVGRSSLHPHREINAGSNQGKLSSMHRIGENPTITERMDAPHNELLRLLRY